jgi:hypothetical protein
MGKIAFDMMKRLAQRLPALPIPSKQGIFIMQIDGLVVTV